MSGFRFPSQPAAAVRAALQALGGHVVPSRHGGGCTVVFWRDGVPQLPGLSIPRRTTLDDRVIQANIVALAEGRREPVAC